MNNIIFKGDPIIVNGQKYWFNYTEWEKLRKWRKKRENNFSHF